MKRPVSRFFGLSVLSFFGLMAASQKGHAGEGTPTISLETLEKRVAALEKKGPSLELEFHGVMAGAIQSSFMILLQNPPVLLTEGESFFIFRPQFIQEMQIPRFRASDGSLGHLGTL